MNLDLTERDRLEETSNFVPWKLRLQKLVEETNLWENVVKVFLELVKSF
jgi:hypothetical protein